MKFVHLSDLHLGKTVHEFNMLNDQWYVMRQIIEQIKKIEPDGILLAGDIYDRNIPSAEAMEILDYFLTEMVRLNISAYIISGNHDSAKRLSYGEHILRASNIYLAGDLPQGIMVCDTCDQWGPLHIYLMPFMKPAAVAELLDDQTINTYEQAVAALLKQYPVNSDHRNILVTHHFVVNGDEQPLVSDSETVITVGVTDQVDVRLFDDYDYVALGHLHRPQHVGRKTVRYSGSMLKYSFSEADHDKSLTILEVNEKGNIDLSFVPLKPLKDMRKIKGLLDELLREDVYTLCNQEDYIHVTLTDDKALIDPMYTLRSVYPNVMQLAFEKHMQETEIETQTLDDIEDKDELELFCDFYKEVTGEMISESYQTIMTEVIDEAKKLGY